VRSLSFRRWSRGRADFGFSLVELMVVVLIIASLVMIAIPVLAGARKRAQERTCLATRTIVERADHVFFVDKQRRAGSLGELVGEYLKTDPACPTDGTYAWVDSPASELPARTLGCSLHFIPTTPVSTLGYTFSQISTNMASLAKAYFAQYGRWPRTWSPYNYTDLGLSAEEWATPKDHVYYSVGGSQVTVRPADGYEMTVKSLKGKSLTLTTKLQWNLVSDLTTGKWYYRTINKANEVDITTLKVVRD